jgi:RNA polymerase sigma factor (sigma-70 family)
MSGMWICIRLIRYYIDKFFIQPNENSIFVLLSTLQPYEEKEILQGVAKGNEVAFRQLVLKFTPLLAPYILKFTKSKERTQEIVQDIFTQIWLSRESLGQVNNFRRYLYVASRNHALNAIRNMVREEKRHLKWLQDQPSGIAENTATQDYSPYIGLVEEAVQQLPEQQKKVWVLCRVQGKKYREVAAETGLSKETVKKYLQYAQASITKYVQHKVTIVLAGLLLSALF